MLSTAEPGIRLVPYEGLEAYGISFSKPHLRRLIKARRFPAPVYLSQRRLAWTTEKLEAWMRARQDEAEAREEPLRNADEYQAAGLR